MRKLAPLQVFKRIGLAFLVGSTTTVISAQVNMTTTGSVTEQFNTLVTSGTSNAWTDNSTIANWYWQRSGSGTTYAAGSGSSSTGNAYSFGTGTNTDRAMGSVGSGNAAAGDFASGVLLRNTSGTTITDIKVTYTGEQWRRDNASAQVVSFYYKTSSSAISALQPNANGTWTAVSALNFSSPQNSATAGALDGNSAANRTTFTQISIPSLSLANNDYIMLKWDDPNHTGNDHGLSIDDVTIEWTVITGTHTSVQFASTGSTVNENVGTVNLTLEITDEDATNDTEVDVVLITGAPGRVNSYTTQTVTFPGGSGADETVTITVTDNSLCDGNTVIGFELQNINGGQGTPTVGSNDTYDLAITDNDICTGVSFAVTSATVSEGVGTYNVQVNISNFSTTQATTVDVALNTGSAARINNYTTQTVTFPANDGTSKNVTITVTDNSSCDGTAALTFGLENLAGGQGTPFVGPNSTRTLNITDNDAITGEVIARQAFDGLGSDTWAISTGAGNVSTATGSGDSPSNQRILSGTASWQTVSGTFTLELPAVDVSGYSNITLGLRVSAVSGNGTNGIDPGDYVRVYADLNGGGFPGTADVEVAGSSANNNARWLYTGTQTANTTAGTPIAVQSPDPGSTPSTVNGPGTITISVPNGTQSVALRVVANSGSNERWNVDNIQVTGDRCSATYYSRADGNVGAAIWADTPNGTAGSVTFDRFKSMVVQNSDVVNLNAATRVNDYTVNAGGQLDLAANQTFTVSGDVFDIDGTMTAADNSTILLNSTALVTLESTGALDLFNLTANTPGDVLTDATLNIRGTLLLQDGEFDASTGSITLVSNNTGSGRLGPVGTGASYTGNITVQRYIPAGKTNWRFLGSPVAGRTVNDWKDDFYTAGFPGSHSPTFSNPVGSGILWPSIRWYDETRTFNHIDTGWVGVSSTAQALTAGQGFAAWCGTGLVNTTAFTVDVNGAPNVAQSPISRSLNYTNTGSGGVDGFNAVSNPLPSPVLFSSLTLTNVEDYVWIFNPAAGNMAVWDISNNSGTLGGNDTIQSSQGFMVQATGAGASIAFEEADKVNDRQGGFFGGSQQSLFNGVRLKLTSAVNTFSDETLIAFGYGAAGVDGDDVPKMTFAHPEAPQLATRTGNRLFAINAVGENETDLEIPVMVTAAIAGTYTVTASDMANIGLTCLVLEDLQTGTITPLVEGAMYSFAMEAGASTEPRLLLRASTRVPLYAEGASCNGLSDGRGTVIHVGEAPMHITWTDATGAVILEQNIEGGVAIHNELAPGIYGISVSSDAGCGTLNTTFTITEPTALEVAAQVGSASCPNTNDGSVDLTVLGGTAPYTFVWSNGSASEDLLSVAGTYTVAVNDARGCTVATPAYTIAAGEGPAANAEASATTTLVHGTVAFANHSTDADTYTWDFGDGQVSTEFAPEHSWGIPGTYTVSLTADNGDCSATWTAQILVEAITNVGGATTTGTGVSAWYANDKLVVEHAYGNGQAVVVDVLDATGRLHLTRKFAGTPARVNLPADGMNTGIWFVRLTNAGETRTVRIPVVR